MYRLSQESVLSFFIVIQTNLLFLLFICFLGDVSKGLSQLEIDYCNSLPYNPVNQICCNGIIHTRSSAHTACCGQGRQYTWSGFKKLVSVCAVSSFHVLSGFFNFWHILRWLKDFGELHIVGSRIHYNDFVLSYINL